MANLIIKPQNVSGDKVIIQDQAGGAVLTTADSGATIANATLDNATQDGITRLGTVTTGTMKNTIHTDATFPVGHILQTKYYTSTVSNGTSTTAETTATAGISLGYVHITPLKAGSVILVTATWSYNFTRNANFQAAKPWVGFKIGTGNQTGTFAELRAYFNAYDGVDDGSDDPYRQITQNFIHYCSSSYSLGQTISYEQKFGATRGSGSVSFPTVYYRNNTTSPAATMILQEIAQ